MARSEVDDFDVSRTSRIACSERGPAVVEVPPARQRHSLMTTWARLWTWKLHKRLHTLRTLGPMQVDPSGKGVVCGAFEKPSSGLEPETPPYHW
jgi:hypothetical protein